MSFQTVEIPIQEILLSNFATDIATISNANDLLLKDALEDLLNNLEIDVTTFSIGTDNPISYVRADSFIIQDTGFIFQTGTPAQIIARLEKNVDLESILTIDRLNVDVIADVEEIAVNSMTVDTDLTSSGTSTFVGQTAITGSLVESKETTILENTLNGAAGESFLTLTSASKSHIYVTLRAVSAPDLNPVYLGGGTFDVTGLELYLDFDQNNPPTQNQTFTIHLVDVIENQGQSSILQYLDPNGITFKIFAGTNYGVTPNVNIILHGNAPVNPGVNPNSTNDASNVLLSNTFSKYGHNLSLMYIIDEDTNDRLIITGMTGMELFS